jgi:hypothetical protein
MLDVLSLIEAPARSLDGLTRIALQHRVFAKLMPAGTEVSKLR